MVRASVLLSLFLALPIRGEPVQDKPAAATHPPFELTRRLKPDESVVVFRGESFGPLMIRPGLNEKAFEFVPDSFALDEIHWSPDGKRLAGRGGRKFGDSYEIWILDVEKGSAVPAVRGKGIVWRPMWFPDGKRLIYVRNADVGQELWTLDAATFEAKKIHASTEWLDWVSLNPDGTGAAIGPREAAAYLLDLETGRKTPLAADAGMAKMPAWSPAGKAVAYLRGSSLYSAEPEGKTSRRLSPEPVTLRFYTWSPDGTWIAFSYWRGKPGDRAGGFGLVKSDGSGFRELRSFDRWPSWNPPTWSSDSRQVVFEGDTRDGLSDDLWLCSVTGEEPIRIFAGRSERPAWRPLR